MHMRPVVLSLGLALLVMGMAAVTAPAATVSVEGGVLTYVAEPGEFNEVEVVSDTDVDGLVYVYEYSADVTPGSGCVPTPDPFGLPGVYLTFNCPNVESVSIDLGDRDDYAGAYALQAATLDGGAGSDELYGSYTDDVLRGGGGNDTLLGGPGKDSLDGGDGDDRLDGDYLEYSFDGENESTIETTDGGADRLTGGAGDDLLRGGAGADELSGGSGIDTADYASRKEPSSITLDGQPGDGAAGENDALAGDFESVITGSGKDTIMGGAEANTINAGAGDDTIDPGAGADKVIAGAGDDTIAARDGARDAIDCGDGLPDRVTADADDIAGGDCEIIDSPAAPTTGPAAPPAPAAPGRIAAKALTLKLTAKRGTRGLLRLSGRLALPAGASLAACSGQLVKVTVTVARRRSTFDVPLDTRCRFSATVPARVGVRARVSARAAFAGSAALSPATSRLVRAKAAPKRRRQKN